MDVNQTHSGGYKQCIVITDSPTIFRIDDKKLRTSRTALFVCLYALRGSRLSVTTVFAKLVSQCSTTKTSQIIPYNYAVDQWLVM